MQYVDICGATNELIKQFNFDINFHAFKILCFMISELHKGAGHLPNTYNL